MDEDKLAIEVYKWLVKNLGFEDTEESFIKWKKGMLEMTEMNKFIIGLDIWLFLALPFWFIFLGSKGE